MKSIWGTYIATPITALLLLSCTARRESPLQPKPDKKAGTPDKTNVETADDLYSSQTNLTHFTWGAVSSSKAGAPVITNNYEFLRRFEGSYSFEEMQNEESEPLSFMLQSSWFTKGTNTPQIGIRMRTSPKSGEFEFGGSELYLPKTGFGVSYEQIDESEDPKAYLNIKRKF